MEPGKTTTYINPRLANLLDEHGPTDEGARGLAEKLNYIVPGWDKVLRDEKARWRALLTKEEWIVLQACTISHAFAMESGGPIDLDLSESVLACVADTLDTEIAMDNAEKWRASTIEKIKGATVAAQLALVWMLIRERNRGMMRDHLDAK